MGLQLDGPNFTLTIKFFLYFTLLSELLAHLFRASSPGLCRAERLDSNPIPPTTLHQYHLP